MPRRALNMIEMFERASFAKKIVSEEELGLRLRDIFEGRAKCETFRLRPLAVWDTNPKRIARLTQISDEQTYEWMAEKPEKSSEIILGQRFKSGISVACDALIDMANGHEVDAEMVLSAFAKCENHAAQLAHKAIKPI